MCRPSVTQLWAVKVPLSDRRPNGYLQSVWDAIPILEREWAKLEVNESETGYDIVYPESHWPDPEWRDDPLDELIQKAFRGKFIADMDHEIIKEIQGRD